MAIPSCLIGIWAGRIENNFTVPRTFDTFAPGNTDDIGLRFPLQRIRAIEFAVLDIPDKVHEEVSI